MDKCEISFQSSKRANIQRGLEESENPLSGLKLIKFCFFPSSKRFLEVGGMPVYQLNMKFRDKCRFPPERTSSEKIH